MITKPNIPDGWRMLSVGELRQDGDQFYLGGKWQLSCLGGHFVKATEIVIRCRANERPIPDFSKKKKLSFSPLNLLPSRLFKKSSAEKVKEYLAKLKKENK